MVCYTVKTEIVKTQNNRPIRKHQRTHSPSDFSRLNIHKSQSAITKEDLSHSIYQIEIPVQYQNHRQEKSHLLTTDYQIDKK